MIYINFYLYLCFQINTFITFQNNEKTTIHGPADGKPTFYFRAAPQFEAPADSKYGWLNNALFVCAPEFSQQFQGIVLNVWKIK